MSTSSAAGKGDDRNLVPAEASSAFSFEDRALEFGKKNRNLLFGVVVVVLGVIAGVQVMRSVQEGSAAEISQAYGAAETIDAKRAFARAHPDHPLAGLALLAVADDSYTSSRYEDAARDYAAAAAALEEPLLRGRARIGEGVALLKAGQTAPGEEKLRALVGDSNALMAHRTQAYYEIAAFFAAEGDRTKAREAIDQLKALDPEGIWANVATSLRSRLDAEELTAASPAATPAEGEDAAPTFTLPGASATP